jgi:hypothetical protein
MLREQGFPGPLNGREAIQYVGHIQQDRINYKVYLYRGIFKAATVDHGANWLIVIKDGATYLGGYHIPMPSRCKIEGQKAICSDGTLEFTKSGPPAKILFGGESFNFVAATIKKS